MRLESTRHQSPAVSFRDAVRGGLAPDGGLYLPAAWPAVTLDDLRAWRALPFADLAVRLAQRLLGGEFAGEVIDHLVRDALDFPVPVVEVEPGRFILELFHGPTLAFKDFGARFLARFFGHLLAEHRTRATILVATSGDTGSAVAQGFFGVPHVRRGGALSDRQGVAVPGIADGHARRQRHGGARAGDLRRLSAAREDGVPRPGTRTARTLVGQLDQHRAPAAADVLLRRRATWRWRARSATRSSSPCRRAISATSPPA